MAGSTKEIPWDRFPRVKALAEGKKWLELQHTLGLATNTIEAYARGLDDFVRWCKKARVDAVKAGRAEVAGFVGDLRTRPSPRGANVVAMESGVGLSNATMQQRLTVIRLFFDYLIEEGHRDTNPVGRGRYSAGKGFGADKRERGLLPRRKKLPWIPNDEEWRRLLDEARGEGIRNRCMLALAYDAGPRREELCGLESGDLQPAHRLLRIRAETSKSNQDRVVPYSETTGALLAGYLEHRRDLSRKRGPLFLSESRRNRTEPITLWTWSKVVRRIANAADLPTAQFAAPQQRADIAKGVAIGWTKWIERWHRTSALDSRNNLRIHLYKLGRWLGAHHPDVTSPEQWTRDLCVEFVAAATRMKVGDYSVRKVAFARAGQPLSPRAIASELVAARTFFWDCQEWGWIARRFDPSRSLALPRSLKSKITTKPRVIADASWARLLAAGLELQEADLPRAGRAGMQGFIYPIELARAVAVVWLFAGLRSFEISRLRLGCVRWQDGISSSTSDRVCLLDVPVNKTKADFTKPVDPHVGKAIEAWLVVRPKQPQRLDRKTGESVALLFMHRARPMRREFINESLIPTLFRKAGVPLEDVRGRITSHRARATIASQLFNSREPMTLFELQAWLGHGSPASTQHYVAITPTKLAKAYADAGYFERNMRAIEVLVDQDAVKQAATGEPWRFYDLGHGLCSYEFFDQCAHRMACARCDFYRPGESDLVRLMTAKTNLLRLKQDLPLTDEEKAIVDGDVVAIERLTRKLADRPTPSGQTPTELRCCGGGACSRSLTPDST